MSLVPTVTNANPSLSLLGGGSGPTPPSGISTISQLYVSTISAVETIINMTSRLDTTGEINVGGELNMLNSSLNFSGGVPGGNIIQFGMSQGEITGISSINGAVYPPVSPPSPVGVCYQMLPPSGPGASFTITGGTAGSTQSASDPWTSVVGEVFRATITFEVISVASGTPAADAFLFFNLSGAANESVHIPLSNITLNIPMQISVVGKATAITTDLEVGLNDSNGSVINFGLNAIGGVYSMFLEKLGEPQTLT